MSGASIIMQPNLAYYDVYTEEKRREERTIAA